MGNESFITIYTSGSTIQIVITLICYRDLLRIFLQLVLKETQQTQTCTTTDWNIIIR